MKTPKVSIGIPVYNGEKKIEKVIQSFLDQTFNNFEIIISDNCSTDDTSKICKKLASKDSRIKYFKQSKNIGDILNFEFVLKKATAQYFTWAADDDLRTKDFLENNINFLGSNPEYVASTSPNCYEGEEHNISKYVNFSLDGDIEKRFIDFLKNIWNSHAILKNCTELNKSYAARDWSVNIYLISTGKINRTNESLIIFGKHGISNTNNPWKYYRKKRIEIIFPLFQFSIYLLRYLKNFKFNVIIKILIILFKINLRAFKSNISFIIKDLINK